jgi:hypothetical protein
MTTSGTPSAKRSTAAANAALYAKKKALGLCRDCNKKSKTAYCKRCLNKRRKKLYGTTRRKHPRPTDRWDNVDWTDDWREIALRLKVSTNAVKHQMKKLGIWIPKRKFMVFKTIPAEYATDHNQGRH